MPIERALVLRTHLAGVVTFVSPVEALDSANRLGLFLRGLTLVDIQPGGGHVNDKQANQVTKIEFEKIYLNIYQSWVESFYVCIRDKVS